MEDNRFVIRSRNVFDSVNDSPYPAAVIVNGTDIEDLISWEEGGLCGLPLIDYGEKMIMPAFVDAHTHFVTGAVSASRYVCDTLGACHSEEECAQMIRDFAAANPDLKRIRGTGWFIGGWNEDRMPTKASLDRAVPDLPVYLQCADCHSFWLNSAALKEAGIKKGEKLENGIIETDENGELTGILLEPAAMVPADKKYMDFSGEELKEIFRSFQKVLAENGICALSEMFAEDYTPETMASYDLIRELDREGELAANVYAYTKLFGYTDFSAYKEMSERYDTPHFSLGGVKGFVDGVTETYTGMLLDPYTDRPETCGEKVPLWPAASMQEEIIAAGRAGIQVRLHCIGDGAVRLALDLYEKAREVCGEPKVKNTIEHIENIHPDDLKRFKEIGVTPSVQPMHIILSNGDKIMRIGRERCRYEWPFRSIMEAGGKLAFGTDYPVVGIAPMPGIAAAVTRSDENGRLLCRNPEEMISLSDALKAYTAGAAAAYGKEDIYGTIRKGCKANLVVLDCNPFECVPSELYGVKICQNYFEGRALLEDL